MRLASLALHDFRNFPTASLALPARTAVFVGQNGQGKTNLLEAVHFAATLRPLRAGRLVELVRFGSERCQVTAIFEKDGVARELSASVGPEGRTSQLDGKPARTFEDYFAGAALVAFTPDDLEIVKGAPEGRRRALDRAVFNRWPAYLAESRDYSRALKNRNRALRAGAPRGEREAFEEPLARLGARLWSRRQALLTELVPRARETFLGMGGAAPLDLALRPAGVDAALLGAGENDLAAALREALVRRLSRDTERAYTSAGPHADELTILLGGEPARAFASQGQQRAVVLSLKIAEIDNLTALQGAPPLLLLDDISSELDPDRSALLLARVRQMGAQALLTTTDLGLVAGALDPAAQVFRVAAGAVTIQQ